MVKKHKTSNQKKQFVTYSEHFYQKRMIKVSDFPRIQQAKIYYLNFSKKENRMGTGTLKSIAHLNSYNQYLYYYIDRNQVDKIQQLLAKKPELLKVDLTRNSKTNALNKCCYNGNLNLVRLFVQKYGCDVNATAGNSQTPLVAAIKRNHIHIVRYLLQQGADPDYRTNQDLLVIQYAILQGLYEAALLVYEKMKNKELRTYGQYREIALQHKYRYVNYKIFLESLVDMIDPDNTRDFLSKEKKVYDDPVIDPRETWKQWFKRNLDFKDPPLVQRSELPEELQPQNRKFAQMRHFFNRLTVSPMAPRMSLKPQNKSQFQDSNQVFEAIKGDKLELQTIS